MKADAVPPERREAVVFMAYRNTLQADALKLVAKKLQSSLAVEGEFPEDADSVESVFAQAQQVAADAEALLVDVEWAAPEPVVVEVHANGNGRTALPPGGKADDETPERQRSLFSWTEFIAEEPAEPTRRSRGPAPIAAVAACRR